MGSCQHLASTPYYDERTTNTLLVVRNVPDHVGLAVRGFLRIRTAPAYQDYDPIQHTLDEYLRDYDQIRLSWQR